MEQLTCKKCGSTDIVFFKEKISTYYYKIKKDGTPYKRPYKRPFSVTCNADDGCNNFQCCSCGEIGGGTYISDNFVMVEQQK